MPSRSRADNEWASKQVDRHLRKLCSGTRANLKAARDMLMTKYDVKSKTPTKASDELSFLGHVIGRHPER